MANSELESLQKEYAYYENLLKKHEFLKNRLKSHSSVVRKMPASSNWKQPTLPVHEIVKNSNQPVSKSQYSYNKLQTYKSNSYPVNTNKRTVLFNQNKYFKAESYAELSNQTTKSIKITANKIVNKRTVLVDNLSNKHRTVINVNNVTDKALTVCNISEKVVPCNSKVILNEIIDVTQQLKKTSENRSKLLTFNTKSENSSKQSNINKVFKNNTDAFNKYNLAKSKNTLINKNHHMVGDSLNNFAANVNSSLSHKQNYNCKTNSKKSVPQTFTHYKESMNKYMYKKDAVKLTYSKNNTNPLKFVREKDQVMNFMQSMSDIQINVPNTDVSNLDKNVELKALTMEKRQVIDKKLNIDKCPSNSKAAIKESTSLSKVKSPIISKEKRKAGSVYKKINKRQPALLNKSQFKTNSTQRTFSNVKMGKGNSKYKFVNKKNVLNKMPLNLKSSSVSKENFPVQLNESDPLLELLHSNSAFDKLEQDLLVISSSLTDTTKPVTKNRLSNDEIYQCSTKKVNSTFCLKKTPLKRSKVLASKYKLVNKTLQSPQNSVKTRNSTPFRSSVKKLNKLVSKFSVVNKHPKPMLISSPAPKGKSILVRRLYKSKSTIINKNTSPTNQSAKIIKSKYFALNKRKSPSWQKHISYQKMPLIQHKFKGHYGTRSHSKQNKYKKSTNLYHPRGPRRFSSYGNCINNKHYSKNFARSYAHQTPVRVIRGIRYSLSSSGKRLRKLPTRGQTQSRSTPKRVIIAGKSYSRTSENMMKTNSPITTALASRVLHRSINRVLSASTKKSLTKVNTYCMFYNRFGRCNRGVKCTYIHDPSKIAVCTRYLRGTCKIDGCPFSHEVAPGKMAICSFFLVDACEKDNCPYRHEKLSADAALCKAFVQGYCPKGKECNKAHILICPKFIQGECEKGSSCAFPHPPQKVRRNVQKEVVEDKEVEKPDDALLEKVARYFQPLCEEPPSQCQKVSVRNDKISLFVPQRKRLEEQPSFIPLSNNPVSPKKFQPGILGE